MFGSIRKRFNSVIQEGLNISENISGNYINPSSPKFLGHQHNNKKTYPYNCTNINLFAGCHQLDRNEEQWCEIHNLNEQNADKATIIDKLISDIQIESDKVRTSVTDLNVTMSALPVVINTLNNCVEIINDVSTKCSHFEKKLADLEDLMEVLELQGRQLDHRFEMAMYKEKKLAALELVREELTRKHAEQVLAYEKKLRKVQLERQMVFQDAFQNDLKVYKEQGHIPKVESKLPKQSVEQPKELSLEEIILDETDDTKALDDFLNN